MRQAEANHVLDWESVVIAFSLTLGATLAFALYNDVGFVLWLTVLNIAGNVYPVMLQRSNRLRLERLISRRRT